MPYRPKVLFVVTSHAALGDTGKPTGWYLPEFAHPYAVLSDQIDVIVASPKGGEAPLDPSSVEASKEDAVSQKFLTHNEALWKKTEKLESFIGKAKDFEALFFVGGHGPMWDLANNTVSHQLILEFHAANKIIAAVCHGPAALVQVKLPSGKYFLEGEKVTGFSNSEEEAVGLAQVMPFHLEDALAKASGGGYVKAGSDWGKKVVVGRGGRLVTGQNPASAQGVGQAIYDAIFGELTTKDEV